MSDIVQNVVIRWSTDTSDLTKAEKAMENLSKEEQDLVHGFDQVNTAAKKAGDTIQKESTQAANNTNKVTKSVSSLSGSFSSLRNVISSGFSPESFKDLGSELVNVAGSTGKASVAMQVFKVALASTGVGLLVVALGALYAYFNKTEEGGDRAARSMRSLQVATDALWRVLSKLGEYIADYLVVWIEIFTVAYGALAKFIGVHLQTFAKLADALGMDGLAGSLKTAGDAMVGAEDTFRAFRAEAEATGEAIANLEDEIEGLTTQLKIQNAELQTLIEKDLKALRNRTISYQEALGVVEEISAAEKQMLENNVTLNDKNIQLWYRQSAALVENKAAFYDLYKGYKEGRIGGEQYIEMLNNFINSNEKAGNLTQKEVDALGTLLVQREEYNRESIVLNEKLENYRDSLGEREKARIEKARQDYEKRYQEQLKNLSNEEKISIRYLQLNGATEAEITIIKQRALEERIALMQKYHKQDTFEYRDAILQRQQLELDYERQTQESVDRRTEQTRIDRQNAIDEQRDFLATQTALAIQAINDQAAADKKADEEKLERKKQLEAAIQDLVKETANAIFTIQKNQLDRQLQQIQTQKNAEIAAAGDSKQAIAIINEKYAQQEAAIKRKQAQADRAKALFDIITTTSVNVVKAIGTPPVPNFVLAGITAAIGAAQAAAVLSKPIPAFNKGTRSVPGVDTGKDSVLSLLRPGEAVVPVDQNKASRKLIDGIISGSIDDRILNMNYAGIEKTIDGITIKNDMSGLEVKIDQLNHTMKNLKTAQISFDKSGFHTYLVSANAKTEFMNNYFRN